MKQLFLSVLSALLLTTGCGHAQPNSGSLEGKLSSAAFQQMMDNEDVVILDVRTPREFKKGHIKGAVNYDIHSRKFDKHISTIDKNKPVLIYCKSGVRSADAARRLGNMGFDVVYDLQGGILAWEHAGFPLAAVDLHTTDDAFTLADLDRLRQEHSLLLIDYYADWCAPCKKMEPILKKLEADYGGKLKIVRVDVDKSRTWSRQQQIDGIPVVVVYRDGQEVARRKGFQSETALTALLMETP